MTSARACPYCQASVRGTAQVCPECGAVHHLDCWRANEGCAIPLCKAGPKLPYIPGGPQPPAGGPPQRRIRIGLDDVAQDHPASPGRVVSQTPPPPPAPRGARRPVILAGCVGIAAVGVVAVLLASGSGSDKGSGAEGSVPIEKPGDPEGVRIAARRTRGALGKARDQARDVVTYQNTKQQESLAAPVQTQTQGTQTTTQQYTQTTTQQYTRPQTTTQSPQTTTQSPQTTTQPSQTTTQAPPPSGFGAN